ncbi:MAG: hypothetical protein R3277_10410 [Brumimicrobium sp.]|nr:hypothetical protein [Brumimicrobium sp.]
MKKTLSLLLILTFAACGISKPKEVHLPESLQESSALVYHKGLFISLNDSGGENALYVFSKEGELVNTCTILHAKNVDWEALTFDGVKYLYIGDIGNNANKRKNQKIYKVRIDEVLSQDSTDSEIINFHYPDQEEFPPADTNLYYDAEALIYLNDSLFVFTKNRTVPFDGLSKVYAFSAKEENPTIVIYPPVALKASSWMEDSVTDAHFDGKYLHLLTYSKIYKLKRVNYHWEIEAIQEFETFTQREGLTLVDSFYYLTEESENIMENAARLFTVAKK